MMDASNNATIDATQLKVSITKADGSSKELFTFSPTAATYTANGSGILYFALPSIETVAKDNSLTEDQLMALTTSFTVTDGSGSYTVPESYILQANIYYTTTLWKPNTAANYRKLSEATQADYGKVVCAAGHLHEAKTAVPNGCIPVGIIGIVDEDGGHGMIIALHDAQWQSWNTISGWDDYFKEGDIANGRKLYVLPMSALVRNNILGFTKLGDTPVSDWCVGGYDYYDDIFKNLGTKKIREAANGRVGYLYDYYVNAYFTTGIGGSAMSGTYCTASSGYTFTNSDGYSGWTTDTSHDQHTNNRSDNIRPVMKF